jgi:translation initiation factor IF-3
MDRKSPQQPQHNINDQIRAREVRLIAADGEQVGIVPIEDALRRADEAELDLVEVAPQSKPPVARILDYGKFRYEMQKREKVSRKKGHQTQIKKIRISPKIEKHDYDTKMRSMRSFLESGDKVKVTMMFRGRMVTHKELGREVLDKMIEELSDIAKLEGDIQMEGHRHMTMTLMKK